MYDGRRGSAGLGAGACRDRNGHTVPEVEEEESRQASGQGETRQEGQIDGGGVVVQRRRSPAECRFSA
jgi:hypothetical protein